MRETDFQAEQEALLSRMASEPAPVGQWKDGCYGSRLAWLTFVGPSPGGGDGTAEEVPRGETETPMWNADYKEPFTWRGGFRVSMPLLVEIILGRRKDQGALKLYNFTNFDWMQNPNAGNVPEERMRRGSEVVREHLQNVQPRVVVTMERTTHQLLSELLGQKYTLRCPQFGEVKVLINAGQVPRYHRQMDAYEITGSGHLSGTFVLRSPQHPARIFNADYARRVARALRHVLLCLADHEEPIVVKEE